MHRPFAQRYAILLAAGKGTYKPLDPQALTEDIAADVSRRVLQAVRLKGWQIGKTRVFLRAGQLAQLEVYKHTNYIIIQNSIGLLFFLMPHPMIHTTRRQVPVKCWLTGRVQSLHLDWLTCPAGRALVACDWWIQASCHHAVKTTSILRAPNLQAGLTSDMWKQRLVKEGRGVSDHHWVLPALGVASQAAANVLRCNRRCIQRIFNKSGVLTCKPHVRRW